MSTRNQFQQEINAYLAEKDATGVSPLQGQVSPLGGRGLMKQWGRASSDPVLTQEPDGVSSSNLGAEGRDPSPVADHFRPDAASHRRLDGPVAVAARHGQAWQVGAEGDAKSRDPLESPSLRGLSQAQQETLTQANTQAQEVLAGLSADPQVIRKLETAFGKDFDPQQAQGLIQDLARGKRAPAFEVRSREDLKAEGAYGNQTIYLAEELLAQHRDNPEAVATVIIEELGHGLDQRLNPTDAPGDEGAIFAKVAKGEKLSPTELAALRQEDDHALLTVEGQEISVENSVLINPVLFPNSQKEEKKNPHKSYQKKKAEFAKMKEQGQLVGGSAGSAMINEARRKELELDARQYSTSLPSVSRAMKEEADDLMPKHNYLSAERKGGTTRGTVKNWQQQLRDRGLDIKVDGDFGGGTVAATKQFQRKHGLTADGIVGPKTLRTMESAKISEGVQEKKNEKPLATSSPFNNAVTANTAPPPPFTKEGWEKHQQSNNVKKLSNPLSTILNNQQEVSVDKPTANNADYSGKEALSTIRDNLDTFDLAAGKGGRDGVISLTDIKAISSDKNASSQVREAANFLIDNPKFFKKMESTNDGRIRKIKHTNSKKYREEVKDVSDGKFTALDIDKFLTQNYYLKKLSDNAELVDNAYKNDKLDNIISKDDIKTVANGRQYSDELRLSAQYFLDNENFFSDVETSVNSGKKHFSDKLSLADIKKALDERQANKYNTAPQKDKRVEFLNKQTASSQKNDENLSTGIHELQNEIFDLKKLENTEKNSLNTEILTTHLNKDLIEYSNRIEKLNNEIKTWQGSENDPILDRKARKYNSSLDNFLSSFDSSIAKQIRTSIRKGESLYNAYKNLDNRADELIDKHTKQADYRSLEKKLYETELSHEIIALRNEDPIQAAALTSTISERLDESMQKKFADEIILADKQQIQADAFLLSYDRQNKSDLSEKDVLKSAQEIQQKAKKERFTPYSVGPSKIVIDAHEIEFELDKLAHDNPEFAMAVKTEIESKLNATQIGEVNRLLGGGATFSDDISSAENQPIEGLKGGLKGTVNGTADLIELVDPEMDLPRFELKNSAQRGGANIGVIIETGLGVKSLFKLGGRGSKILTRKIFGAPSSSSDEAATVTRSLDRGDLTQNSVVDGANDSGRKSDAVASEVPRNSTPNNQNGNLINTPSNPLTQSAFRRKFMDEQLTIILEQDNHPLRFLVKRVKNPKTGQWKGEWISRKAHIRGELDPDVLGPIELDPYGVQAGHTDSVKGLAVDEPETLALEGAYENQGDAWWGAEKPGMGASIKKTVVDIEGIPVEIRTAQSYEDLGWLPKGTVKNAKRRSGVSAYTR